MTYSISVTSADLTLSPLTGTLSAGQQQTISVTASATAASLEYTVTVNPGGISVTIYNTPVS